MSVIINMNKPLTEFGKENTVQECLDRAKWENDQLNSLLVICKMHRDTAKAYLEMAKTIGADKNGVWSNK